jgi:DNA-binding NtrC family response regulator
MADGGTLFLDEIANVPLNQQTRLLRVLETGEFERVGSSKCRRVNTRVISATNANLSREVEAGRFRQDLLFRLNTVEIHLPPLRERREDIPPLANYFLQFHIGRYRKTPAEFDPSAMEALMNHPWRGNVRELNHVIERAVLMADGPVIARGNLGFQSAPLEARPLDEMSMEEVEAFLVRKALKRFDGNVSKAADALGLSRSAFYRRMEKHGI